jgi:hypothetical protein
MRTSPVEKILKHLGLWEPKPRPPPRVVKSKPVNSGPWIDYAESQVVPSDNGFYVDPEYPTDLSV